VIRARTEAKFRKEKQQVGLQKRNVYRLLEVLPAVSWKELPFQEMLKDYVRPAFNKS